MRISQMQKRKKGDDSDSKPAAHGNAACPVGTKKAKAQEIRNSRHATLVSQQNSAAALAATQVTKNNLLEMQIGLNLFEGDKLAMANQFRNTAKQILLAKMLKKAASLPTLPAAAVATMSPPNEVEVNVMQELDNAKESTMQHPD